MDSTASEDVLSRHVENQFLPKDWKYISLLQTINAGIRGMAMNTYLHEHDYNMRLV